MRIFLFLCFFSFILCFQACSQQESLVGVVATVNEENIYFTELERRRNSLYPLALEQFLHEDPKALEKQYLAVLDELIHEKLILQFMESKDLLTSDEELAERENRIRGDYPQGAFEDVLLSEGLSERDWRESLRNIISIERFFADFIRPEVSISAQEVEDYYLAHRNDFLVPELWHFLQISSSNRSLVEASAQDFITNKNATSLAASASLQVRDIQQSKTSLPENIRNALVNLKEYEISKLSKEGDVYQVFVLIDKIPSRELNPAEIYDRVELALIESKLHEIYLAWLEKRLKRSTIRISPQLLTEGNKEKG